MINHSARFLPKPEGPTLCADCIHLRKIETGKGSTFIFCKLSDQDDAYSKYPRQPVAACPGFKPAKFASSLKSS